MLKSTTGWMDNGNGEDIVGFSALSSGTRGNSGNFSGAGSTAHFWSSSETNPSSTYYMTLSDSRAHLFGTADSKRNGDAVRCVKD